MAHHGGKGTTSLGRDSISKRLGVKLFDGQRAKPGSIIIRQRGSRYRPGKNVRQGKDFTLFSVKEGLVRFRTKTIESFNGKKKKVKFVEVL